MGDSAYSRARDEYAIICEYHRSEDQLKWQVLAIAYGGAAVLAGVAIAARYSYASVATAAAAAAVTFLGTSVYFRIHRYTLWRLERARVLERDVLGFQHHLMIDARYHAQKGKQRTNAVIQAGYWLPWLLWFVYLGVSILRHQ